MAWISSMLRMAASRLLSSGPGCCASGTPRWTTRNLKGMIRGDVQRGCHLAQRRLSWRRRRASAVEKLRWPRPFANASVIGAWTECRSRPASASHSFSVSNRRRVVIVEVAARGEHLDRLESVRRNLEQVRLLQPLFVVEVRRNSKPFHACSLHNRPLRQRAARAIVQSAGSARGSCERNSACGGCTGCTPDCCRDVV